LQQVVIIVSRFFHLSVTLDADGFVSFVPSVPRKELSYEPGRTKNYSPFSVEEGKRLARRRYQRGQLLLIKGGWFGRWYEDIVEDIVKDGRNPRPRPQKFLGTLHDYPTRRLAQRALEQQLRSINNIAYRPRPTATFSEFAARWETSVFGQKARRTQRYFFTVEDVHRILSAANEPYRTWYALAAETGLRAGELCGLTLDDVNLELGVLQVRQSSWRGKLGEPKTEESVRVVELSPQACAHLGAFLKSWRPNPHRLVFSTRHGTPWDQNLLLKRKFRPLLRSLGIVVPRGNGLHSLRHSNATLMNSFGASHRLRQERLGHAAGSKVTEAIYTHVISEDGRRIAAQLGNAIWGQSLEILDADGRKLKTA
jgi:integrase